MTHRIRLRGPWELVVLDRETGTPISATARRAEGPGDWAELLDADFVGTARYSRRFNQPTNLEPHERVWLVVEAVDPRGEVRLNGQPLGTLTASTEPNRFEITPLLRLHNLLEIDLTLPADMLHDRNGQAGGLPGEVRLEIS